jgi:hypothetical protein
MLTRHLLQLLLLAWILGLHQLLLLLLVVVAPLA